MLMAWVMMAVVMMVAMVMSDGGGDVSNHTVLTLTRDCYNLC